MRRRHFATGQHGQALVEFAFVIVAFMLLAMAAVDLGRGILYYNMLANAVREGGRYGVIVTSDSVATQESNICSVVENAMQAPGTQGCSDSSKDLDVVVVQCQAVTDSAVDSSKETGTEVSVTATYKFSLITPLIGSITGNPITLSAATTMYNENWGPSGGCS